MAFFRVSSGGTKSLDVYTGRFYDAGGTNVYATRTLEPGTSYSTSAINDSTRLVSFYIKPVKPATVEIVKRGTSPITKFISYSINGVTHFDSITETTTYNVDDTWDFIMGCAGIESPASAWMTIHYTVS